MEGLVTKECEGKSFVARRNQGALFSSIGISNYLTIEGHVTHIADGKVSFRAMWADKDNANAVSTWAVASLEVFGRYFEIFGEKKAFKCESRHAKKEFPRDFRSWSAFD